MTAHFIHYARLCSCSFTYESFMFSYVQCFCKFISPVFYELWHPFHTSFIISSVHVMRLVVPFSSYSVQKLFNSCFRVSLVYLIISNPQHVSRTTYQKLFSLSLSLLVCSYQPRFILKSQKKWPFIYTFFCLCFRISLCKLKQI